MKRKQGESASEQLEASTSKSKPVTVKKPKYHTEPTAAGNQEGNEQPAVRVCQNPDGEKYVELGKKKRVAVRLFKGQVYVDIREFYGPEGDEKPGKKGISLAAEQWDALKKSITTIDSLFAELDKK